MIFNLMLDVLCVLAPVCTCLIQTEANLLLGKCCLNLTNNGHPWTSY